MPEQSGSDEADPQRQQPHQEMTQQLPATFSIWSHNSLISTDSAGSQKNVPWISFHLWGTGSAFANPEGAQLFSVSLPFPGSPGSARKCKGEVSAWEIKGSQGKMTLGSGSWIFQHHGKVVFVSTWISLFNISKKFNVLFKRRDFFSGNAFGVRRARAANNFPNKHPPFKIRNRNCQLN